MHIQTKWHSLLIKILASFYADQRNTMNFHSSLQIDRHSLRLWMTMNTHILFIDWFLFVRRLVVVVNSFECAVLIRFRVPFACWWSLLCIISGELSVNWLKKNSLDFMPTKHATTEILLIYFVGFQNVVICCNLGFVCQDITTVVNLFQYLFFLSFLFLLRWGRAILSSKFGYTVNLLEFGCFFFSFFFCFDWF